ncbi:MAG TPA: adenosylcobalamin-dependent ribonucleoside-diphosphate reductase, partial [Elusimicrobiales bacterium]|nr:adenosylcobalamin-dependent ribonucleoside-diphosphate reductase [Elusimicrobiales bacterium]
EEAFYGMLSSLEFLPNSPTLLNAGSRFGQLSACFVLPVEDSIQGIFSTLMNAAEIHKSGGGTGFSFSSLRPSGSRVEDSKIIAKGPLAYLHLYNQAMGVVEQGGVRRGGNMGVLLASHPDIFDFIRCKSRDSVLSNFNISVAVTDEFMSCLEAKRAFDLVDPNTKKRTPVNPEKLWNELVSAAHANGEPGVIFIDTVNRHNPTPHIRMEATNPCGEQPLLPYESCNLGSINLSRFVKQRGIDYNGLGRTVRRAVHFLDNVIDINNYPIARLKHVAEANRKIGLGVMGFADMLIALNVPYDSETALQLASKVMSFIREKAVECSEELAAERGAFSNFPVSVHAGGPERRNATLTTIAPTGSISLIAGCSSGIEPLFGVSHLNSGQGGGFRVVNPLFENIARTEGFYSEELMRAIDGNAGSVRGLGAVPETVQRLFSTAADIPPAMHVRMQAEFQKHTDNAVSKTVNLPSSASVSDISELYKLAWKEGCKGITVYRDGSRNSQPLTAGGGCATGTCGL